MSRSEQAPEEQALQDSMEAVPQSNLMSDSNDTGQNDSLGDRSNQEESPEATLSTDPALLPNLGGKPDTPSNQTNQAEIPLDTLTPNGQTQRHPSPCPCPDHNHDHDRRSHHSDEAPGGVNNAGEDRTSERLHRDVEKEAALEQVVILVLGVHCSGCADDIQRELQRTPGVSHPNVSIVLGRIDLQLDTSVTSPQEVLRVIRRRKKVRVMLASEQYHHFDISIPSRLLQSVIERRFPGLLDIVALSKESARVSYDPRVSGARTLLEQLKEFKQVIDLAPPDVDPAISQGKRLRNQMLLKLCIATILTLPVAILNLGHVSMDEKEKAVVSLVLATLVQGIAVPEFYIPALKSLIRYRTLEMDMLVTVSITAAYVYSITAFGHLVAGRPLEEDAFFETSSMLITFVLLGRFIAHYSREYAVEKVSVRSLQPTKAIIVENGQDREVDSRLLQYGDRFKVLPQSKIPTDGDVVEGGGEVDESMLTGESLPVQKRPGSAVSAGTINGTSTLIVQLKRLPGKNTVTDIAGQVEEASKSKPRVQEIADRLAKHVVVAVVIVAILVFVVWFAVEFKVRHSGAARAVTRAITYAVAVLAVSCPCALGLAVPMVIVVAGGLAAKIGVVVKTGGSTVDARKVTDVVFDKTGTITQSALEVYRDHTFSYSREVVYPVAKALVQDNRHPVSLAVNRYLEAKEVEAAEATGVHVVPGQGVVANVQEAVVKAGNPQWNLSDSEPDIRGFVDEGYTVLSVTRDDVPIVCFALRSQLQHDTVDAVKDLTRRGITVHLISGDQDVAVRAAAREAGIPDENVVSKCSLRDKVDYVSRLQTEKKYVMFCGDWANDAGAVARADVGVHVGGSLSSNDITCDAANVVLLNGLRGISYLLDVSHSAWRRIVFNFGWALVYNTVAILMASGTFVKAGGEKARVPPQYAGLGELVSVLPVVIAGATMFFSRSVRRQSIVRRLTQSFETRG